MIELMYFPDDTFVWDYNNEKTEKLKEREATIYGYWKYRLRQTEVSHVIQYMDSVHSIAEFDPVTLMVHDLKISIDNLGI